MFCARSFTGLALKFYLNERPFEPRERDYALVGSFYVFSIWIGMGFAALMNYFKKFENKISKSMFYVICLFAVPCLMAFNNWDDHDRSKRYTAQSISKAYLQSIDKNKDAMIFTIGDNDTFSLWYAQEIEEIVVVGTTTYEAESNPSTDVSLLETLIPEAT